MKFHIESIELPEALGSKYKLWFLPEIHSNLTDHRSLLRKQAVTLLRPFGISKKDETNLLNLDSPPLITKGAVSLSHSPEGSVVFYSESSKNIGVDIEIKTRISESVLKRVSSKEEFSNHPPSFDLFTSKEACWKALNDKYDLPTLSHIETFNWDTQNVSWWNFSAKSSGQNFAGIGYSRSFQQFFLSFFILDSTFVRKHRQR